jgi:hypothetical protein
MTNWDTIKFKCPLLYKHGITFECGPGWYDLVFELSMKIESLLKDYSETFDSIEGEENIYCEMYAMQLKEKYGTLRLYMSCETNMIAELIHEYEARSYHICENCGQPGKIRGSKWYEVRCNQCYEGKEND